MRNQLSILTVCLSLFTFVSCKTMKKSTSGELVTTMSVEQPAKVGKPIMVTFTVHNTSGAELKFLKWHTPFEGFKNKVFEIKNDKGEEVRYKGIMAKRIMPPPADAYLAVKGGDTVKGSVDLLTAYDLSAPGKYTIVYQGNEISGLKNVNEVTFTIAE